MKKAVIIGLALGLIGTVLNFLATTILGYAAVLSSWMILFSVLFTLGLLIWLGRKYFRPQDGDGTLYYGEALKYLFVATLVSGLVSTITGVAMYSSNDEFKTEYEAYSVRGGEKAIEMAMGITGASEEEIALEKEKAREELMAREAKNSSYPYTVTRIPMMFLMAAFIGLVLSLIAAIFVKKKGSYT